MVQRVSTGSPFEAAFGYSRAVRHEDTVYVSGTTGYDYATMTMPDDVGQQASNALATIDKALREAGSSIADTVRVVYYVGDRGDVDAVVKAVGPVFKDIRPAASMLIVQMIAPGSRANHGPARLHRRGEFLSASNSFTHSVIPALSRDPS